MATGSRQSSSTGRVNTDLNRLLTLFQMETVQKTSPTPSVPITELITAGPRLTPEARMDIYRRSYFARLEECLADDYPALQAAVGDARFTEVCRQYIERYPPSHPSLNRYGEHFSEHCAGLLSRDFPADFLAELAELEWCLVEAVHAQGSAPLPSDSIHRLAHSDLEKAILQFNPSLRVRKFTYPVNSYFQKWADGLKTELPLRSGTVTAIFRSEYRIVRASIPPERAELLRRLLAGTPISSALAGMQHDGLLDSVGPHELTAWFREWMTESWIAAVEIPSSATVT
jgi:Putative DNA-binding domain